MKVTALQSKNDIHIAEKAELIQDNQDLKKEKQVLQDDVIRLENEVQTGNEVLIEYEGKLENYEKKKRQQEESDNIDNLERLYNLKKMGYIPSLTFDFEGKYMYN